MYPTKRLDSRRTGKTSTLAWCLTPLSLVWLLCMAGTKTVGQDAEDQREPNALIDSSSPYLLQHAYNPVKWMPWGPDAFAKAKRENKPIFVSVGYSTCYWCHVMERESFEDEEVAAILNERYVAIKVDREQRPDIDEQLMLATQLLTGRGGWPNSVWLTTDGRPWMGGTYFPKQQFMLALNKLADAWTEQPQAIDDQANSFADAIRAATQAGNGVSVVASGVTPIERGLQEARQIYDAEFAGFGGKPKFPPHGLLRLLAFDALRNENAESREMLTQTLDAIWCGGIHDHVGGGFHRYATDQRWFLPHFEKMLYDNAQLMRSYTDAYEVTQDAFYRTAVADIAAWLKREMTDASGGFYSAIDSESDGEEGRYYTWSLDEVAQILSAADATKFAEAYRLEAEGNFTEEATGDRPGTNIPYLPFNLKNKNLSAHRAVAEDQALSRIRELLRQARRDREYPHLDDKVLASWNGLMIAALANAGRVLEEPEYVESAARAADFVLSELLRDGTLQRSWRAGKAEIPGYLEDYAFMADALLELHLATKDQRWLHAAEELVAEMLVQFEDTEDGGFFFTGPKHEQLVVRSKSLGGGGNLPVANGVAAGVLLKLWQRTDMPKYQVALRKTLSGLAGIMQSNPRQVEMLVLADAELRAIELSVAPEVAAKPQPSYASQALRAELRIAEQEVRPGQTFEVAVVLTIADGFHLIADARGKQDLVKVTSVRMRELDGWTFGEVQKPAGTVRFDQALEIELSQLSGQVEFVVPVTIGPRAEPGRRAIEVELEYQACDEKRCLLPETVVLASSIQVMADPKDDSKR